MCAAVQLSFLALTHRVCDPALSPQTQAGTLGMLSRPALCQAAAGQKK